MHSRCVPDRAKGLGEGPAAAAACQTTSEMHAKNGTKAGGAMREYIKKILAALKSPALGKIWESSKGEKKWIALLSVLYALGALLSLGLTLTMKELVDAAVAGQQQRLLRCALVLAAVIGSTLLMGYIRRMLQLRIRTRLLKGMRAEAVHRLLHKQYGALQGYHSGELVNRIFSDVNVVADGILSIVPPLLYLLIQLLGAMFILYRLNARFMLILVTAGAFGAVVSFAFRHKMKDFHKTRQHAEDRLHARVQETFGNLRIIKASSTEMRMEKEVDSAQQQFTDAQVRQGWFSAFMGVGLGLIFQGSWFYALLWGCSGVYRGDISYGMLTAILQLVGQIQSPFEGLISTLSSAYGAVASAERLMELYDLPDEEPQEKILSSMQDFRELSLNDVYFSYDGKETVLSGVDCTLRQGETVAIMGPSGCGKSTLFSLLLGIYAPTSGSIRVKIGNEETKRALRSVLAYVPQGNALFSGTLGENIALFCETEPTEDQIWQTAKLACIDDFIRAQEKGLNAVIGERGLGLSEGQAQRIAIARALLMDKPVLLLDEATSALDEQTEASLLENIAGLKNKTCLIVTHRKAALRICTRRLTLKDGRLTESEETEC